MQAIEISNIAEIGIGAPTNVGSITSHGYNVPNGHAAHKNGNGKTDAKKPAEIEITTDSDVSLFTKSLSDFPRLEGEFTATVTKILLVELPPRGLAGGKKTGRKTKAKAGKLKQSAKAKATKPADRLLRLSFTLDAKRADGMTYVAETEVRPKRERESKFAEFVAKLLPEPRALDQFFNDYRPSQLLNRRCTLKIKELRREGQSTLKILDVTAAPVPALDTGRVHFGQREP